ncbi:MAG TPA: PAS domain S-box protein [Chloroflexia bacterium]|nr:PAS domain S-box protein [Chloroflexia bacterium]
MITQVFDLSNYTFSIYALPTFLTTAAILLLGLAVLIRERISSVSFSFFLLTLFVSIWLFGFSCAYLTTSEAVAVWWSKAAYLGVPFIAPATYQFTVSMLRLSNRKLVWFGWIGAAFFSAVSVWTDTLVGGVHNFSWGYYTRYSWMGAPFLLFFAGMLVASMVNYWTAYRKAIPGTKHRLRVRSLMLAFAIGYIGSIDYVAAYGISLYPFGYLAILGFLGVAARAIWVYHLVDITPAFAAPRIIETMSEALLVLDQEGIVRVANHAAGELYGYSREELIGKPLAMAIEDELFTGHLAEFVRDGIVQNREMVYRLRTTDDGRRTTVGGQETMRFLSLSISTMEDQNGRQVAVVCTARDITEGKRAEAAIFESETRYRAVVEQASEGIYLADIDTRRFVEANDAFLNIVGYSAEELYNMTLYDIIAHDRASIDRNVGRLLTESRYIIGERQFRRKDGSLVDVEVSINLISHGGREVLCAVAHDVTERKRAREHIQKQLDRVAALRNIDMAITASHDLRVTLNVILEQVTSQLHADAADVLLLNPHTQVLEYAAGRGFRYESITSSRVRLGEGYAGRAALERRTIHISDLPDMEASNILLVGEEMVTYFALPLVAKGQVKGVLEIFHRAPLEPNAEWVDFAETLAGQAAIAIDNANLFDDLQRSMLELVLAYDTTLEGWSQALDLRDKETEGHTQRVTSMAEYLAREMGLSEAEIVHVRRGALLHDIGKMGIPDAILLKRGPLTEEEWEIMKLHPVYAYELLSPIKFLRPALDIPYCHHEKWDGTGYPRGLKGTQIPIAARIFAVVDVWDALRSNRPYRKAWPINKVREHIRSLAGTHFDPKVVEVFLRTDEPVLFGRPTTLDLTLNLTTDLAKTVELLGKEAHS